MENETDQGIETEQGACKNNEEIFFKLKYIAYVLDCCGG